MGKLPWGWLCGVVSVACRRRVFVCVLWGLPLGQLLEVGLPSQSQLG